MTQRSYRSIGDVLTLLRAEFPDITISKIRFLESQGLVSPQRSPSGYRKFYDEDVERLRYVLRQQREHFLPLKVIRDRLNGEAAGAADEVGEESDEPVEHDGAASDAVVTASVATISQPKEADKGVPVSEPTPAPPVAATPSVADMVAALQEGPSTARTDRPVAPKAEPTASAPIVDAATDGEEKLMLTYEELMTQTGLDEKMVNSLIEFGLLRATTVGGMTCFEPTEAEIATLAARYAGYGVEPRHLRQFRSAAEREAGLVEQLIAPMLRQRNPDARQRAESVVDDLVALGADLHAALTKREIDAILGR